MLDLEKQLDDAFAYLGIEPRHQESVKVYMNLLKMKDEETYGHSGRVGLKGIKIAEHLGLDPTALFFPGILHDVGKIFIDPEILKKTGTFSEEDMVEMKNHPIYAYYLLKGIHEFSAQVALRHHEHQKNKYPEILPDTTISTKLDPDYYAMLVSLADFYDSINTRENDRFGGRKLSWEEIKHIFISDKPDQRQLIEELYDNGIFGNTE
jgi:response regulator RpfG family c-di-GMP phosphodiesterase